MPDQLPKTGSGFIDAYSQSAIDCMHKTGVPASITLAQAFVESAAGRHAPGFNFFGMKGKGTAGSQMLRTKEQDPKTKKIYTITAPFRKYNNAEESFEDHARLLSTAPRYKQAMAAKSDAHQFAREIQKAGYATALNYASALISIIDKYGLTRFDTL
jgi:flagellum-specific peptidoglycan hydrolase FlgJ